MRLWEPRLLKVLPDRFIVSQWHECIAIKRQWEKGTLKHRLVSYVQWHDYCYFNTYIAMVVSELQKRNIKFNYKFIDEICTFCNNEYIKENYPEHNDRYLKQCYYNLQEKYDRGIITEKEWEKIEGVINENN